MEKIMVSLTKEMKDALEEQRKKRLLDSIPETVRTILSEYLSKPEPEARTISETQIKREEPSEPLAKHK
jgi:Arc/MetJ-type ribon-helix-helix transcriptional regulator